MKNRKGFTLIELLAVIIILGILMVIAVPAVSQYIDDSKKNTYVSSARSIMGAARNFVNSGKLAFPDKSMVYYIPVNKFNTENELVSPYADFSKAYVGVTNSGDKFSYYFVGTDIKGNGIKVVSYDDIEYSSVESGVTDEDVMTSISKTPAGKRRKATILQDDGTWGDIILIYDFPEGKNQYTVQTGDIVKIDGEEFYLLEINNTTFEMKLIKKDNIPNSGGYFSDDVYWKNKIGTVYPGVICEGDVVTNCANIYKDSLIKPKVDAYVSTLDVEVKESRVMTYEEYIYLSSNGYTRLLSTPGLTGFWLANPASDKYRNVYYVFSGSLTYGTYRQGVGVRPIIIV